MNGCQQWSVSRVMFLALLLVHVACATSPRLHESSPSSMAALPEMQIDDEIFNISNGSKDDRNRYASTVLVFSAGNPECSGVLIHRRLVLTAAHCVCHGREEGDTTTLGSSTCEKTAMIRAIAYTESGKTFYYKDHMGVVRSHRDFKAVLKKKKLRVPPTAKVDSNTAEDGSHYVAVYAVQESQADLAVIVLSEAVEDRFPTTPPARTNILTKDPVVVAGYGADAVKNGLVVSQGEEPTRRFGKNIVAQLGTERFTIESPGSLALPGDSGGPCFREDEQGLSLVGINSRSSPGRKASFTSTYPYLKWLDAETQRVNKL